MLVSTFIISSIIPIYVLFNIYLIQCDIYYLGQKLYNNNSIFCVFQMGFIF